MTANILHPRRIAVAVGITLAVLAPARLSAAEQPPVPLPPDGSAYGMTLTEWATAFSQWLISIPKTVSPVEDRTGQFAGVGQRAPVWFLAGPPGGTANRTCAFPSGVSILVPVLFGLYLVDPAVGATQAAVRAELKRTLDSVTLLEASVDGVSIPNLQQYRLPTPLFTGILPSGNVFGVTVTEGTSRPVSAVAEGFWILLPPLPAGQHVIQFRSAFSGFDAEATCNLTVLEP
jgi:hypothetical protein